ncbi:peptidase M15 [Burkholderia sp. AU18528]|uniref:D-Ala-D-Ala carboxypeptidase family metallohydrolase n=1 Tax=Burkholderia TaxID=32008 RepID=UPI000C06B1C5|nr:MULTISPECIES: D-Ala-D-Ala carboxypeptidase family metallohydrolase [Burkholderia]PHP87228.1 peptidase M15 [Burkholderia sp. AU18528]RQX81529.1 peptidase M15 [Burkholderia anthina]
MQLTPQFTLEELTRSDTARDRKIDNTPTAAAVDNLCRLAPVLEQVRVMLGSKPIRITSGYRNQVVNRAVGGVPNSDHLTGRAADFQCSGFGAPRDIARAIAASGLPFDQIINEYDRWEHISVPAEGATPRRQALTARKVGVKTTYTAGV